VSGKRGDYKIPFDGEGNMLHYPESYLMSPNPKYAPDRVPGEWRDNEPFQARLELVGFQRGRSAAYFMWRDEEGHTYPMFLVELERLLRTGYGVVDGRTELSFWEGRKQGNNYSITWVDDV
jgi:hypothetical protein